ncbi:alpha/beta fold hydrolase [Flavobacterium sp. LC2016-23]|uniref:alpha/beta fold hydrolase n=1 Tax=Flavobacterium sp. LC2016-23 TaxID=2666330 RepID=UPI0012B0E495|nr:alpha/beta fold hydrolase [Flavobacterium sp. LC2016-23]MRX40319.1 alpha/beta fold hydrolase [Flavobacterium sp. LC2016-23]
MLLTILKNTLAKLKLHKGGLRCIFIITICAFSFSSCSDDDQKTVGEYPGTSVDLGTHKLMSYTVSNKSKYLVVFESGHGNDHTSWYSTGESSEILSIAHFLDSDVLLYDRAGYGKSGFSTAPRTINTLRSELEKVVDQFAQGRKVILVGHSLGGVIIRDYAIKNPAKVAGLVFVDASHEKYNHFSQDQIDVFYNNYKNTYGVNSGIAQETLQLIADFKYAAMLPNLPDVPVIAITSMKIDPEHDAADRQLWYDSKEALKAGVTDFTHITTVKSGHFIQLEEPELVLGNIKLLLSKLPL